MYITLATAKKHLNLEDDFTEDDTYINQLISASQESVEVHVNDNLETLAENNGGTLPTPLVQAMLLMISNLYVNREPVGNKTVELPYNYRYLIDLYRNYNN